MSIAATIALAFVAFGVGHVSGLVLAILIAGNQRENRRRL
jgi:hypothetical protein